MKAGEEVAKLYRGPLEEFTQKRNELAKELSDPSIAKLKKPTAAAWLVDQLAERKPKQIERLVHAAAALRKRQEELLAGESDAEALRAAGREEQKAIEELLTTARALAREHGASSQVIDRVGETLQAASGDPELAEQIRAGTVVREQRSSATGFEGMPDVAPAKPKDTATERREREAEEKALKQAERRVAAAEKKVAKTRGAFREAEAELQAARKELEELTG